MSPFRPSTRRQSRGRVSVVGRLSHVHLQRGHICRGSIQLDVPPGNDGTHGARLDGLRNGETDAIRELKGRPKAISGVCHASGTLTIVDLGGKQTMGDVEDVLAQQPSNIFKPTFLIWCHHQKGYQSFNMLPINHPYAA